MSPKKKNNTGPAQQLIDSLLDERTPGRAESDPPRTLTLEKPSAHLPFDNKPLAVNVRGKSSSGAYEQKSEQKTVQLGDLGSSDEPLSLDADSSPQDQTVRLDKNSRKPQAKKPTASESSSPRNVSFESAKPAEPSVVDRAGVTELRTVVKMRESAARPAKTAAPLGGYGSSDAQLKQSESLRFAQSRINELETELERLRRENENLASAGDTLGRRADELLARAENLEIQMQESARIHDEERKVFRGQVQQKDRENFEMRARIDEMEGRLENNFNKIRVSERELKHRLEILRMESSVLVSTKDKMILDLKRQIDQLSHENENAKQKAQEHYKQYNEKQETARRVVRALRIALTILEGDETAGQSGGKKGE